MRALRVLDWFTQGGEAAAQRCLLDKGGTPSITYGHHPYKEPTLAVARSTSRKEDRLEFRLEPAKRRLLDEAAAAMSMSTSAFVLSHATAAAQQVLADRTTFVLPTERWDAFVELLERDERPMPGLAAFLARPSVLDEE